VLEQIGHQLKECQPTPPAPHGRVVLFLIFAFVFSSWLLYRGVEYQVKVADLSLRNQLAVEITQTDK